MKIEEEIQQKLLHMTILNLSIDKPIQLWDIKSKYRTIEYLDIENAIPRSCFDKLLACSMTSFDIEKEMEMFLDIKGFENGYQISQFGNVKSKQTGKLIPQVTENDRYKYVSLFSEGTYKNKYIHRLVASHFIINEDNYYYITHLDGNTTNNNVNNLKWGQSNKRNTTVINRPIIQFDFKWKRIREWKCANDIFKENPSWSISPIYRSLSSKLLLRTAYTFIWRYKDTLVEQTPDSKRVYEYDITKKIPNEWYDKFSYFEPDLDSSLDVDKPIERWMKITGYPRYMISDHGKIYALTQNKMLTPQLKSEYHCVNLYDNDKKRQLFFVHRLVAQHFIKNDNPDTHNIIDHFNSRKTDNVFTNLRWVTASMNSQHYHDNFESRIVLQYDMNKNLIKEWNNVTEILKENPTFKRQTLLDTMNSNRKKSNKYMNYIWQYKDPKVKQEIVLEDDEVFKNVGTIDGSDFSLYDVSNYGRIRNSQRNTYLKPAIGTTGYYKVIFAEKATKQHINIKVHRIVAELFCEGKSEVKNHVNHKNFNKLDNSAANLEWISQRDNVIHATGKKVNQIDINTNKIIKTFDSIADAQRAVGCADSSPISAVCRGRKKSCRGFKWAYVES